MQGQDNFGQDVVQALQESAAERVHQERRLQEENDGAGRSKVRNEATGRMVFDTEQNAEWRRVYEKRVADNRDETEQQIRRAIAAKNMGSLNILNTTQVSEELKCSKGTAYLQMRAGIIPSFTVGRRHYTHDYIIAHILEQGRKLVVEGYANRTLTRMVWKAEQGQKW